MIDDMLMVQVQLNERKNYYRKCIQKVIVLYYFTIFIINIIMCMIKTIKKKQAFKTN